MINQCSEIKAIRKYLGLEIKEAAAIVKYTIRSWQYWEKGEKIAPGNVILLLDCLCVFVRNMVEIAESETHKSIPYFLEYADFCEQFPNPTLYKWQIWQRILGLIRINGHCEELTNTGKIDNNSKLFIEFNQYFKNNHTYNHINS